MKYVYYQNPDGDIVMVAPIIDVGAVDPFIEVSDDLGTQFLEGSIHPRDYYVIPDATLPSGGIIKVKNVATGSTSPLTIHDRVYLVPVDSNNAEFIVTQNINLKTIAVVLNAEADAWWRTNNFFNRDEIYLIACVPTDPHLILWQWFIKSADLSTVPLVKTYTGSDQMRFYTRKIFKSYSHEQFN